MNKPRIEVLSHVMMAASHLTDMLRTYDVDTTNSPLSMPEKLAIGSLFERHLINTYQDQVSAYDIWLEDTLKGPDSLEKTRVMVALDNVYNMAVPATPFVSPRRSRSRSSTWRPNTSSGQ